jgi:rhamnogalacturonyl hydrolase YesR
MMGVATEGMYYYWLLTGDKDTLETIRSVVDFQMGEGKSGTTCNAACCMALMYAETKDEKYKEAAMGRLKPSAETRPKGFGQSWRSSAYAWYYLSNLAEKK